MSAHPAYGEVRQVRPGVRVLLQRNPGHMTLDGTNTWLLGSPDAPVVVDPGQSRAGGPEAQLADDGHLERLLAAAPAPALVLLTHRHHDHVELAGTLHAHTGAPVRALDPALCRDGGPLADGDVLDVADVRLEVLATPGHTSDSTSYLLTDESGRSVLTGDTVLGRGTTVVAHPDGALGPYLASLGRLRGLGPVPVLPGHGPELPDLEAVTGQYLEHRALRLDQVRDALRELGADASPRQVVETVYADVDPVLWDAAELSVRAQLDYLRE
ncbi:MBL fold metallo-hydrolase [Jatrophihabitans fulvus]